MVDKLGEGSFGSVWKAECVSSNIGNKQRSQGRLGNWGLAKEEHFEPSAYAVKLIDLENSESELEEIQAEISVLSHCSW